MSLTIKNALVTTEKGSRRTDVTVKEGRIISFRMEGTRIKEKELDASQAVSKSIINWFAG